MKKLVIRRELIKRLNDKQLKQVVGGNQSVQMCAATKGGGTSGAL